jgi:adenylate cyclase
MSAISAAPIAWIGAEANLAARLQSIAEPGGIVVSYETFALAREIIDAHALAPITMKGISREVIPYSVDSVFDGDAGTGEVMVERIKGLDFYLDATSLDAQGIDRIRSVLNDAIERLDRHKPKPAQ